MKGPGRLPLTFGLISLCVCFACNLFGLSAAADSPFSVRQVLSAPFPSSLTAAPTGQRFAWVFNAEGVNNIWGAEGPEFKARQLTSYDKDDGRHLTVAGFSHDGKFVYFSRSSSFNPDQDPAGNGDSTLLQIDWQGKKLETVVTQGAGAVSPADHQLAYSKGGELWLVTPGEKPVKKVDARGGISDISWSPDGTRLLMTISRGQFPHQYSYIMMYDLAGNQITYMDASVFLDRQPIWSPKGDQIAFLRRLSSDHTGVLTSREFPRDDPWEIRLADPATGRGRSLWKSSADDNFEAAELAWIDTGHLIFTSEEDGFRHLYSLSAQGDKPRQLTKGSFEVETFLASPAQGKAFFVTNENDVDRRHIWMTDAMGSNRALTSGQSIEWSPVPSGNGRFLGYLASDATHPARVFVRDIEKGTAIQLAPQTMPSDFPTEYLVAPRQAIFEAADGQKIHGQLFMPPSTFEGPRAAIMYFHGGPVRQMLLGFHYSSYYHNGYAMNQYLASQGYVVLTVNYRLGIGYGRAFRDVEDGGPRGASEYQDLLAGARFLRNLPQVDANRIGLWGGSYGGLMTALGLSRNSDLFAAGVDIHGVHDWNQWQAWAGRGTNDDDRTVWKSSPLADVKSWRSPVLFIHADDDRNVPFSETIWLVKELEKQGVDYELLVFPDEVHSFLLHRNWIKALEATADFFRRKLKGPAQQTEN